MSDLDNDALNELRARVAQMERQQRRRVRVALVAAVLVVVFGVYAPVAFSAPEQPVPCSHDDLYCFAAGTAARADQVNSNFETLHAITDDLGAAVIAANANAEGRLAKSGGTVTGNLTVNGSLSVPSGLPIARSLQYSLLYNSTTPPSTLSMGTTSRRICFSQGGFSGSSGATPSPPGCRVMEVGGQWQLAIFPGINAVSGICYAQCLSW